MTNIIDTIKEALDSSKLGSREVKVWIAEKVDNNTFLVADESRSISLVVENKMILQKKFCGEDSFVKIIHPSVSQDGESLILTDKSHMIPLRTKEGPTFRGKPAPFVPFFDSKDDMAIAGEEPVKPSSNQLKSNFGSFEVECFKKPGEVNLKI